VIQQLNRLQDRLRQSLETLRVKKPVVRVIPGDTSKVIGVVVSPTFEGMRDEKRQELVWEHVLKTLDEFDQSQVEFVFTNAPSEESA
jgi:acid stress-induced BolA-like protein IbaG/YrbA